MSYEAVIQLKQICKCFQLYDFPQNRLKQAIYPKLQKFIGHPVRRYYNEFLALQNITFDIYKGETVGIIGRNGSGKSTLLQIICETLNATSGNIKTTGKIAALLELGSGFNPEFTGRENVYMNGAILGLNREEIDKRFDKIAMFADIGDFIDQPVKSYSSGMYVRLAFAVIAHVDADVLIIDEALAVGDAVFTQKCMRFLRSFKESGTLIFVSHDMSSVLNLCERAIWLDQGQIRKIGNSKEVADAYLQFTLQEVYGNEAKLAAIQADKTASSPAESGSNHQRTPPKVTVEYSSTFDVKSNLSSSNGWKTGAAEITDVQLENLTNPDQKILAGGETVRMRILAIAYRHIEKPIIGFLVKDRLGQDLFGENTLPITNVTPLVIESETNFKAEFTFKLPMLPNGAYSVMASIAEGDLLNNVQHHWLHEALIITVSSSKVRWGLVGLEFDQITIEVTT